MAPSLLATKLYTPPLRPDRVSRPRLLERLDAGLHVGHRLTLVSAAAGCGKTTLIGEWTRRGERAAAWLSLDAGDNNPIQFLTYLTAALQQAEPQIGQAALQMLHAPQSPQGLSASSLVTLLINDIATVGSDITLVLDDYHVVSASPVHKILAFLVEHPPPSLHLVIITREDPPLPLPRLRARDQVTEIRDRDLRFTAEETATFLTQTMGLNLTDEAIAVLEARTEGWIAGLQLAALSMRGRADVPEFITAFSGSNRFVFDYLVDEVLARQPAEVQRFLLLTSILDRLTGSLCDALTGRDDGQAVLEALEQANLFIVPMDQDRRWYRYYHLFAEFLRGRLRQSLPRWLAEEAALPNMAELHRRASEWCERHGLAAEAVEHALAAPDFERAARLIEASARRTLMRDETGALLRWMAALPETMIREHPVLSLAYAWALVLSGQPDKAEETAEQAARAAPDSTDIQGEVTAIRAIIASLRDDVPRSIELATQALETLPAEDLFLRGLVALSLGVGYDMRGDLAAAARAYGEALAVSRTSGNFVVGLIALNQFGDLKTVQGRLHEAADFYRQAVSVSAEPGKRLAISGTAYLGLGLTAYEWDDLEEAASYLTTCIELGRQWQSADIVASGSVFLAQVRQAQGKTAETATLVQQAEEAMRRRIVSQPTVRIGRAYLARMSLRRGDLDAAEVWAQGYEARPGDISGFQRGIEATTWARLLIAREHADEAVQWLDALKESAERAGMTGTATECLMLRALALQAKGDQDEAAATLLATLAQAEPEDYIRTFADEGPAMERLLRRVLEDRKRTGRVNSPAPWSRYIETLLAACGEPAETAHQAPATSVEPRSPGEPPLIERLSEREIQVLRLLAAGLSSPEIARKLVIEASTVRSHLKSIYGKLEAHSRYEAIERARALHYLT